MRLAEQQLIENDGIQLFYANGMGLRLKVIAPSGLTVTVTLVFCWTFAVVALGKFTESPSVRDINCGDKRWLVTV
jgi:hypothetical protein